MDGDATDVGARATSVPWYNPELTSIPGNAREILEKYSKIPPEQVGDHVKALREKAWQVYPYPCIGQFRFLDMSIEEMDSYPEMLKRLKSGDKLLDLGCCFGQEIRKLVFDGVLSENLFGADLHQDFFQLGYDLFCDRDTLKARFIQADIFDKDNALQDLRGSLDIVYTGSFFHVFGYEGQLKAGREVAKLLKGKGSMVVGRQIGSVNPGEREHRTNPDGKMMRHNLESWRQLWERIGEELGIKFSVTGKILPIDEEFKHFHKPDTRRLWFEVKRE
ncbi:hypothetical protein NA57DRAFT_49545 [Rhizodiscina lignyota]|uniref:Methyltransferase type 11 domain-containing protein n=1 Tax=Rhizodiscina lignyota TaxID=1504668 RepID=A0A9P4I3H0_9PEZI|nr:hypothetical protein NA57DRAFT_49545 [Rhizodiscina lignyota]